MQTKIVGIFVSSLLFIELVLILVIPRVEQYTQNAAIVFYKNKIAQNCYIDTYGFKSYAHYFYSQKPNHLNIKSKDDEWLLSGKADKTVYIVCKNVKQKDFEEKYPHFVLIDTKNGFAFYIHNKK